jgi:hypothetical protein
LTEDESDRWHDEMEKAKKQKIKIAYVGEQIPHTPSFTPQRGGELNPTEIKP